MATLGLALLPVGCGTPAHPELIGTQWEQLILPRPAGEPGRLMLRDITVCDGRWYLVGAVAGPDWTRPAAWSSVDVSEWNPLDVSGKTYYGRQNILYAVGCRDGEMAALGAKSGGAHGNPRVSTWRRVGDGQLVEVVAPFERYGGPEAVNVARITGGPAGWLIVGNRSTGAAVWVSPDALAFDLVAGVPELAGDQRGMTSAFDAVATPDGWLVVGAVRSGVRVGPAVWRSGDGRAWRRVAVPVGGERGELRRIALVGATPVAVGLRDGGFGAWSDDGHGWEAIGRFGATGRYGLPSVSGLVVVGSRLFVAISDGTAHELWVSEDRGRSWREVTGPPVAMPAGGDSAVAMTVVGDRILVAADAGQDAALWLTDGRVPVG